MHIVGNPYIYLFFIYLCLKSLPDHQMANTRNRTTNENNNATNNPPPPPILEQVLIMQAQMLQTMQQTMANMQQAQGHQPAPQPQQRDKLGEFQQTKPPTFSHSVEPMDADDWMKTIEKKLQVVQCNNREKVLFPLINLWAPLQIGGMLTLKLMKNLKALTSRNSRIVSDLIMCRSE
jgi:hypothetical protein